MKAEAGLDGQKSSHRPNIGRMVMHDEYTKGSLPCLAIKSSEYTKRNQEHDHDDATVSVLAGGDSGP
jgi:hypothetical protein